MMPTEQTDQLLLKLAEARTWDDSLQRELDEGHDVTAQIQKLDKRVQALETESKDAMKRLGCVSSQTRAVYHAMADMLMAWEMFKDTLR